MINYPVVDLTIVVPYFFKGGEEVVNDEICSKITSGFIILESSIYELICRFEKELGFEVISTIVNSIRKSQNIKIVSPCLDTWTKATKYSIFDLSISEQLFLAYADINNAEPITLNKNILKLRKQLNKEF